ncbi:hypothetical protein INR49_004767 [Caranx melampygus]|nr:hypothetical protein INR49_004767 [Caranx melampygus]
MLDFAQKTEPGTLHLFLQQQLAAAATMCSNTKLLSTIEPQELQCLLQTTLNNQQLSSSSNYHKLLSTIEPQELQCLLQTTLNNMAKKMVVKN